MRHLGTASEYVNAFVSHGLAGLVLLMHIVWVSFLHVLWDDIRAHIHS